MTVAGKPLDGFLMLAVAILLTFDAGRTLRRRATGSPDLRAASPDN